MLPDKYYFKLNELNQKIEIFFGLIKSITQLTRKMSSLRETLNTQGYAVVENVLNEAQLAEATGYFRTWLSSNPQLTENHARTIPPGIFKFGEVNGVGRFVAVATNGTNRVMTSENGIDWFPQAAAEPNNWQRVEYRP